MSRSYIESPARNIPENLFHFSTDNRSILFPRLKDLLSKHLINPDEFPRAIDLGSGDGGVAAFLVQLGWDNNNVTCVDRHKPPYPVVEEVVWQFIDLEALALELSLQADNFDRLDPRVFDLQGKFDLVTCNFVYLDDDKMARLAEFFLRPNGIAIIDGVAKRREQFDF